MKNAFAVILATLACPALAVPGSVAGSSHDFSASGKGEVRAMGEQSSCVFCHASHRAGPGGLSNRPDNAPAGRPYQSSTLSSRAPAPTGSSRICLSCHDGTIAVGVTRRGTIPMGGQSQLTPGKRGYLDLRSSHPISVKIAPDGKTHAPQPGDVVQLDAKGQVQCTSCHDPHAEWGDPVVGKFLVRPTAGSALCTSCHEAGVGSGRASASHLTAAASPASAGEPGSALPTGGCGNCHVAHGADPGRGQLMRADRRGDDLCLSCHGEGSARPVATQLRQPFAHSGTSLRGAHDAAEGPHAARRLPEGSVGAARHVACVDCHDPHASNGAPSVAPVAGGALAGVWGIDLSGEQVSPARFEYEVCLKCHGDSANKPQDSALRGMEVIQRASEDFNLRRVFASNAISAHPVAVATAGGSSPSLSPNAPQPYVLCSDCHSSDLASGAAGATGSGGVRGPHGSSYRHILERQYLTGDLTPESPEAYALCYKCHVREVLLSDASSFPLHRRHVVDQSTPCSACHDAHGISAQAGTAGSNAHLVAFDLGIVKGSAAGPPVYESAGGGRGSCNLTCHGTLHAPTAKAYSYPAIAP